MTTNPNPDQPVIIDSYKVHSKKDCIPPCPFHAPSDHPLKNAPMYIRSDKYFLVERICKHGVGHDDPDSVAYMKAHGHDWAGVHGCDGCCTGDYPLADQPGLRAEMETRKAIRLRELRTRREEAERAWKSPQRDTLNRLAELQAEIERLEREL